MLQLNHVGELYNDEEPCYAFLGDAMVFDTSRYEKIEYTSLQSAVYAVFNTDPPSRIFGVPSSRWQNANALNFVGMSPWADSSIFTLVDINGEDWIGALDVTPPTGWGVVGSPTFDVSGGNLTIDNSSVEGGILVDGITSDQDEIYVYEVEVISGSGTITDDKTDPNSLIRFSGPGRYSLSFKSDAAVKEFLIMGDKGQDLVLSYCRLYLESNFYGGGYS